MTPLDPFGDNPDEEEPGDDLSKPRKVHYHSKWKNTQDAVNWVNLARAQDKGLRFWQTRSPCRKCTQLSTGRLHVQSDFSNREKEYYLKDSRRLVPHRRWCSRVPGNHSSSKQQQQQQDTSESASSSTKELVQRVQRKQREDQGNPPDNPELPRVKKLERRAESTVEKEAAFKVDLRI